MKALFITFWLLCLAAIAGLALVPNLIYMNAGADKMLHMLAYCLLMLWPAMTFQRTTHIVMAVVLLFIVGIGVEVLQNYVPGRNSELLDIYFNAGGIMLGSLIGYLLRDSYQSLLPLSYAHSHIKQSH